MRGSSAARSIVIGGTAQLPIGLDRSDVHDGGSGQWPTVTRPTEPMIDVPGEVCAR